MKYPKNIEQTGNCALSNVFWINYGQLSSGLIFAFKLMSLKIGNNIKIFWKMGNTAPFLV